MVWETIFIDVVKMIFIFIVSASISPLMSETGKRKTMTFFVFFYSWLLMKLSSRGESKKILIEPFGAEIAEKSMEFLLCLMRKICACRKIIKMNGITTNIFWTLYPDDNGFVKCSYYYRESGKYKIQIDITLFSQNDEIQKIGRLTNIFPWFKKEVAQICSLITVSFFG